MEKDITLEHEIYLKEACSTLENELTRISELQYSCLNDEDLFYTVNAESIMTPFEKAQALLRMEHRLNVLSESSQLISDVKACLIRTNRLISSQNGIEPLTYNWQKILYTKPDSTLSKITFVDNELYMCASYPHVLLDETIKPIYTIIISLDKNAIGKKVLSYNKYDHGAAVICHEENGVLMAEGRDDTAKAVIDHMPSWSQFSGSNNIHMQINGDRYFVVHSYSEFLNLHFISCLLENDIFGGLWYFRNLCIILFLTMLTVAGAFALGSYYLIRKPMKLLVDSLQRLENGELSIRISHGINDEYAYVYESFNHMAESMQQLIEQNYQQRLLTQQAQMRQLQAQINPHFLYNSFYTAYRMARDEDYERLSDLLQYLSSYYQYITRDARQTVLLEEEVAHANNYLSIQKMRFSRRINIESESLPAEMASLSVPRLILQPVLENAFEHGLKNITHDGLLCVTYTKEGSNYLISVENNGDSISEEALQELHDQLNTNDPTQETTGLVNIHRRLVLSLGQGAGVRPMLRPEGGFRAILVIPSNKAKEEHTL